MRMPRRLGVAAVLLLTLAACGPKGSPEERVRAYVARAEKAAEARDAPALKEMIAEDYRDADGRDRRAVMGILAVHFLRNETVHLLTRVADVHFPAPKRAAATVFVAMAGAPIPDVGVLRSARADLYRFDVALAEGPGGTWLLASAAWGRATPEDFF